MKNSRKLLLFIALVLLASCDNSSTIPAAEVEVEVDIAKIDPPHPDCSTAPAEWFVMVNGNHVTPAPNEGSTSVFANNDSVSNCDFHRWSWQKFLWLTNEAKGHPFFLDNMNQVTSHGQYLGKGGAVILTDTAQASGSGDILKTPGVSPLASATVYYSIMANDQLYAAIKKYGPIAKDDPNAIEGVTFPVGSLEMKTAWIAANALADPSMYFVTDGMINGVETRVALLGMHVVGVVENHPEFVWATFEHDQLAPAYDWSKATPTSDAPVSSAVDYPFFSQSAQSTVTNITSATPSHTNIFSLYKYGVPVEKAMKGSNNVQLYMATSQNGSENFNNIRMLNESVKKQLAGVWNNYFYNGSLWINTESAVGTPAQAALLNSLSGNLDDSNPGKLPRGSVSAYNLMMETYVQAGFDATSIHGVTVNSLVNCFTCHSTQHGSTANSPLKISHLFNGYVGSLQELTKEQVKQHLVKEIRAKMISRAVKKE